MKVLHETCTVVGCERKHKSRGYCGTHYAQWKKGIEPSGPIKARNMAQPETCSEEGCDQPTKSRSLCAAHYARFLRHGHTKYRDRKKTPKICIVDGCDCWVYAKGKCHKHYTKTRNLKNKYGITDAIYSEMLSKQNNVCAICHEPEKTIDGPTQKIKELAVDHCHDTGKVRGLLCANCNRGIGLLNHDEKIIKRAIEYLRETS